MQEAKVNLDHLLQEFLNSHKPGAKALESLLFEHAEPLIRRIVSRRLSGSVSAQDREDTAGDAVLELLARLESWKQGDSRPIEDFLAYTAVIARHSCDHHLRGLKPQKYRLRNRIFYLLDTSPEYGEWDDSLGRSICGLARQKGQNAKKLAPGWYHSVSARAGASETEIVSQIMQEVSPLAMDDLLEATAHLAGLGDESSVEWGEIEAMIPGHEPDYEERLDLAARSRGLMDRNSRAPAAATHCIVTKFARRTRRLRAIRFPRPGHRLHAPNRGFSWDARHRTRRTMETPAHRRPRNCEAIKSGASANYQPAKSSPPTISKAPSW